MRERDIAWALLLAVVLLVAHAAAYMTHEYAHSTLAWALGWMARPLALDYGHLTIGNVLLLSDISDNVNYDPIMAAGNGGAAAAIALAGPFIGNGLLYALIYAVARRMPAAAVAQLFPFAFALMCAGNVWSYVPVRALTTHADIEIAAHGFGVSPLTLFPFVLVPALTIAWHFLERACRWWLPLLATGSSTRSALLAAVTAYWFFVFFGGSARDGSYGAMSQLMSMVSIYLLFPVAIIWLRPPQNPKTTS